MTFSVVARCPDTGMFGMSVSSSSPAVAARCAFARAGVGAAASQNITDPALGERCLDLMQSGVSAKEAIADIVATTENIAYRQLTAVDATGQCGSYSGSETLGSYAMADDINVICAGNLLANEQVPKAMVDAFNRSTGHLGDRLLSVMRAGLEAGGEAGAVHSAGLLLVRDVTWPVASLRVDWSEQGTPIEELEKVWAVYSPQLEDYVKRALNPSDAPGYGVPGDE